jgi:ubiquinol-cytochrome c reductase cytochrome b subunit
VIRGAVRFLEQRVGSSLVHRTLRYVFPDHWSFMLGEIALYAFLVLVGTGIYLTFFFEPSLAPTVYDGAYAPLRGTEVSRAFASTVDLSFEVKGGLLIRQTHHWAANVFVATLVLHLLRIFFTGAFRKPRDLNFALGLTMLVLAVLEGYLGYSLPDDLISGMGLAIGYSVLLSVPVLGMWLAPLLWDGEFPGSPAFESRLYSGHVIVLPLVLGALIALHLALIARQKHTDFPGPGRTERNVVGTPLWPGYALRSIALLLATSSVLLLLGGLVQINPVWLWGPYEPQLSTNGAQPDWYLGWLIGALRLLPALDVDVGGYTLLSNAFVGGVLFPLAVFGALYAWPALERRLTGNRARHELLDRPRDAPRRTAFGAAAFTLILLVFLAGSAEHVAARLDVPYAWEIWILRGLVLGLPPLVYVATRAVCDELRRSGAHPLRGWTGTVVERTPDGGFRPRA